MRYLKSYKLFENIQQSESYLSKNPEVEDFFREISNYVEDKPKYKNYIFSFIVFHHYLNDDDVFEYFKKIVSNSLTINMNSKEINPSQIVKWNRVSEEEKKSLIKEKFNNLKEQVNFLLLKRPTIKFIEKYVPGFLKKELKKPENIKKLAELKPWNIEHEKLKGMVSLFNNADEYINFIKKLTQKDSIKSLKSNEDVKIIKETPEYIIYKPESFKAMNCIIFNYWCTINKNEWNKYINAGYDLWVYYDKNDIKNSYMLLSKEDDFYVSDYYNNTIFTDDNIEELIEDIPKDAFNLLYTVYNIDNNVKNLSIDL